MSDEQQGKPAERSGRGKVNPDFVSNKDNKKVISFHGLLDVAHQEGLEFVDVQIVQIPGPDNGQVAIHMATVKTRYGTFTDIGDATPTNVGRMIAPSFFRMSSTRAIARALRLATNVGMLCAEEIDEESPKQNKFQQQRPPTTQSAPRPTQQQSQPQPPRTATTEQPPTDDKPTPAMVAGALKLVIDIARTGDYVPTREEAQTMLNERFVSIYGKPLHEGTRMEVQNLHNTLTQERRNQGRQN